MGESGDCALFRLAVAREWTIFGLLREGLPRWATGHTPEGTATVGAGHGCPMPPVTGEDDEEAIRGSGARGTATVGSSPYTLSSTSQSTSPQSLCTSQAPTIRRAAQGRTRPHKAAQGRKYFFWPLLVGFFERPHKAAQGRTRPHKAAKNFLHSISSG